MSPPPRKLACSVHCTVALTLCVQYFFMIVDHRGIIEDVYILGSPVTGDPSDWKKVGSVVAGHVTNAYCK